MNKYEKFEGLVAGDGNPFWNQSYYWNCYDSETRSGVLIRLGFMENRQQANTWLIVFKDGQPLFTRTNQNLPYTTDRPDPGVTIAGMTIKAEVPLKKTRIRFDAPDFSLDLVWDERNPMADVMAISSGDTGTFAESLAHVHLEGTCNVTGHFVHRGVTTRIAGNGFRDVAAGHRDWDALKHYRLMWPVFDDGTAFVGIHGFSTGGQSAYMRMYHDGEQWCRVTDIEDHTVYDEEHFSVTSADWRFTDEKGRKFRFEAKPLFGWLFPLDTFVLREQIMEFRVDGKVAGYGMCEQGYRLPWKGVEGG